MAPVKVEQVRLTQMQRLADRFKISETWRGKRSDLERFGAPIHRYKPSDNANSDAALFIFALGDNPKAILFVESDGQNWSWGLAPLGAAKMEAKIGDEVVWEFGGGESQQPQRTAAYAWLHLNETLPDDIDDKDADKDADKENGKDAGDED